MTICASCGFQNRADFRFCQACGAALQAAEVFEEPDESEPIAGEDSPTNEGLSPAAGVQCVHCKTRNSPGMRFCTGCGSPLEQSAVTSPNEHACKTCGALTPAGYRYCRNCGCALAPSGSGGGGATPAVQFPVSSTPATVADSAPPASVTHLDPNKMAKLAVLAAAMDPGQTIIDVASQKAAAEATRPANETPIPATGPVNSPPTVVPGALKAQDLAEVAASVKPEASAAPVAAPLADTSSAVIELTNEAHGQPAVEIDREPQTEEPRAPAQDTTAHLGYLVSVQHDGADGARHEITDTSFDVGRASAHLRFPDDPYLCERHCRFTLIDGQWRVRDLSDCNGVYKRVYGSERLVDGDHLLLGRHVFSYRQISKVDLDLAPAAQHGVMLFGSPLRTPWGCLRELTVAGVYRDVYYLYESPTTLGREGANLCFADDEFMSRLHLRLSSEDGGTRARDLDSSNGTFLRIRSQTELRKGDMLRIGDQLLRLEI